jgi:hypothetical protein
LPLRLIWSIGGSTSGCSTEGLSRPGSFEEFGGRRSSAVGERWGAHRTGVTGVYVPFTGSSAVTDSPRPTGTFHPQFHSSPGEPQATYRIATTRISGYREGASPGWRSRVALTEWMIHTLGSQ